MGEILARKRPIGMAALRRHQRHYGGPSDFYLAQYLELAKLVAPATLAGRCGEYEELAVFAPVLFLKPPHPIYQRLADDIRAGVRAILQRALTAGRTLDPDLVRLDELLAFYVVACCQVAGVMAKRGEARKSRPSAPAAAASA